MYRAVALAALRQRHDWEQPERLVELAASITVETIDAGVLLDGEDVTREIRTQEVTSLTHYSANNPGVRAIMVERQRAIAAGRDIVTEGRDQGSVVFPSAECKIFLTATPLERAKRRQADLLRRGEAMSLEQILEEQNLRDQRDSTRAVGPLVQATDAVPLWTDGLEESAVVDQLEAIVQRRCDELGLARPGVR